MGEKKLYLYLRDEDYGKRMLGSFSAKNNPSLRVELVTKSKDFWENRAGEPSENTMWLTDDKEGQKTDKGVENSLIILDEKTDFSIGRISFLQKSEGIYNDLLNVMDLAVPEADAAGFDLPGGVYVVFAPKGGGDEISYQMTQELSKEGSCLYVSMTEFPVFKGELNSGEFKHLGELFFRLGQKNYADVVREMTSEYDQAKRLPGIMHFRDLSDITGEDIQKFAKRISGETDFKNIVILCEKMEILLAIGDVCTRIILVADSDEIHTLYDRFNRYLRVEQKEYLLDITEQKEV
ncbi:MAG: hypothetical protein K5639_02815 [Eubacterium sp.]|nr:hypothetical protein [Eubacterium sp.]